jgi:hypothetical protein
MASRRVRAATVTLVHTQNGLVPQETGPTPERQRHGDLRIIRRIDDFGREVVVRKSLSIAGDFGDDTARLLAAAQWFDQQADVAQLRGRMVRSQLAYAADAATIDKSEMATARLALARVYDVLGPDAFNCVYDTLVWTIEPRGPRKQLLRAALYALARWLERKR